MTTFDFRKLRILVYGDVMLDEYIEGTVERISPEAPVPVVDRERTWLTPGGAANVACNLAALGVETTLVGITGCDETRKELVQCLKVPRLTFHAVTDTERETTRKSRVVAQQGQCLLRIDQGSAEPLNETMGDAVCRLNRSLLDLHDYSAIIVSDYAKGAVTANIFHDLCLSGLSVAVDPKRTDFRFYFGCGLIKPNLKELRAATGEWDVDDAAESAMDLTGSPVLVTLGDQGMSYYTKDAPPVHAQAIAHQVADVSGAGDTVIAVFSAAMNSGMSPEDSVRMANVAASLVVQKRGTCSVPLAELQSALA